MRFGILPAGQEHGRKAAENIALPDYPDSAS